MRLCSERSRWIVPVGLGHSVWVSTYLRFSSLYPPCATSSQRRLNDG